MRTIEKHFVFMAIAMGGYELALPNVGFGVRIAVTHGLFLANAMLIVYLLMFIAPGGLVKLKAVSAKGASFSLLIMLLGLLGIVSALINQTDLLDLGQAARLFLYSAFFGLVIVWSRRYGTTFTLRAYLVGIGCGGLVNLYYTFISPRLIVFDVLPVLYYANGAGGLLGIALSLSAWLWMIRQSRFDGLVAMAVAVIGLCAVALSFSKTAMLIGAMGVCCWLSVILIRRNRQRWARVLFGSSSLLAVILLVGSFGMSGERIDLLLKVVQAKFGNMTLDQKYWNGCQARAGNS